MTSTAEHIRHALITGDNDMLDAFAEAHLEFNPKGLDALLKDVNESSQAPAGHTFTHESSRRESLESGAPHRAQERFAPFGAPVHLGPDVVCVPVTLLRRARELRKLEGKARNYNLEMDERSAAIAEAIDTENEIDRLLSERAVVL